MYVRARCLRAERATTTISASRVRASRTCAGDESTHGLKAPRLSCHGDHARHSLLSVPRSSSHELLTVLTGSHGNDQLEPLGVAPRCRPGRNTGRADTGRDRPVTGHRRRVLFLHADAFSCGCGTGYRDDMTWSFGKSDVVRASGGTISFGAQSPVHAPCERRAVAIRPLPCMSMRSRRPLVVMLPMEPGAGQHQNQRVTGTRSAGGGRGES
jgi:hypothetical protein